MSLLREDNVPGGKTVSPIRKYHVSLGVEMRLSISALKGYPLSVKGAAVSQITFCSLVFGVWRFLTCVGVAFLDLR